MRMTIVRGALVACALVSACASLRTTTPRVLVVDPRIDFTSVDAAAIDAPSLDSAKQLAARRRTPAHDVAEYDLEVELNGSVINRTRVEIAPLPGGLDLVRHPMPGPDAHDPPQLEGSIGVAGAVSVVYWRGIVGHDRKKPRVAARLLDVTGDPFASAPAPWTVRIDRLRGATTYRTCKPVDARDAASVHPSFAGRAVRYQCTTDELGLVERLWFVESLQRYFPAGASLPDEGEVVHRLIGVRYRGDP